MTVSPTRAFVRGAAFAAAAIALFMVLTVLTVLGARAASGSGGRISPDLPRLVRALWIPLLAVGLVGVIHAVWVRARQRVVPEGTPAGAFGAVALATLGSLYAFGIVAGGAEIVGNGHTAGVLPLVWRSLLYPVTDLLVFWGIPTLLTCLAAGSIGAVVAARRRPALAA